MSTQFKFQRAGSAILLSSLILALTACGGGGSDSPASPSNVKDPAPIGDKDPTPLPPVGLNSNRFVATFVVERDFSKPEERARLLIIDTQSNTVAKQVKLGPSSWGSQFEIIHNYKIDFAADEFSLKGQRAVYYIEGGKVFRVDLHLAELPEPVQISNLTQACSIKDTDVHEIDGELLRIQTPGPDLNCNTSEPGDTVQVTSSMSYSASPPLSVMRYASGGVYATDGTLTSTATLVYDLGKNALSAYTKDLQYPLYDIPTPAGVLSINDRVKTFLNAKLGVQLLHIGNALYTTKIVAGKLQFGERVTSSNGQANVREVLGFLDKTLVLFNDGRLEQLVDASKASTQYIATLPSVMDPIDDWIRQDNDLVLVTQNPSTQNMTYYKVNSVGGNINKLGSYTRHQEDQSMVLRGEDLLILRGDGPGTDTQTQSLLKYSLTSNTLQTQLAQIRTIGVAASVNKYEVSWDNFVYCQPLAARSDCVGTPVRFRNLKSNAEIEVGTYATDPAGVWSMAAISEPFSASSRIVMEVWSYPTEQTMSAEVWTFDPKQSNSLLKITLPQ